MDSEQSAQFSIWAVDNVVYGPVELPVLISWIKDERVTAETWVFHAAKDGWQKAGKLPELQIFFRPKTTSTSTVADPSAAIKPGTLRRVKVLADFSDEQLERFLHLMEIQPVAQWEQIVKQGDPGDAMYLVLEGELRVRLMIQGKETILAVLSAGEFFGDIALFDSGLRSADVV